MDDYDKILNYNNFKFDNYEILNTFWFISYDEDQNMSRKITTISNKHFLSLIINF